MLVKKYMNNGGTIFNNTAAISYVSGFYGDVPEWLNNQFLNMVSMTIEDDFSSRELMNDNATVDNDLIADINGRNARLLVRNKQKYDHLYRLFNLDYNPIYNVDSTESITRSLTNTNSSSETGKTELSRNTTDTTDMTDTMTYDTSLVTNDDNSVSRETSNEVVTDGTRTDNLTEASNDNKSRTTFDSSEFYNTDKDVFSKTNTGSIDNDETVNESGSETESSERDISEAKTGTETRRIDNELKHTGKDTTDTTNTLNSEGSEAETITHLRYGNQGVTMTQDMTMKEISYSNYIKFIDIVALDVVRNFSIGC